jgi:hypothetical protein
MNLSSFHEKPHQTGDEKSRCIRTIQHIEQENLASPTLIFSLHQIFVANLLTNSTFLNGTYRLRITVTDTVDNILTKDIMIYAEKRTPIFVTITTTTTQEPVPIDMIVVAAIGSVIVAVIGLIVLFWGKKE